MKRLLGVALLLLSGSVLADELGDANRLLSEKSYGQAFPIYQKLANAGNAEAQMRLGEMYWFGDATAADLGKARFWFERSAAAGNADAKASLASLKRRETHGAEIAYWTRSYDGSELVGGKAACKAPQLPAVSQTKSQIKDVDASIQAYTACYNGLVDNLKAATPPAKRMPQATLDMMTPAEAKLALAHIELVDARIAEDIRKEAKTFAASAAAWRDDTERYVTGSGWALVNGGRLFAGGPTYYMANAGPSVNPISTATFSQAHDLHR